MGLFKPIGGFTLAHLIKPVASVALETVDPNQKGQGEEPDSEKLGTLQSWKIGHLDCPASNLFLDERERERTKTTKTTTTTATTATTTTTKSILPTNDVFFYRRRFISWLGRLDASFGRFLRPQFFDFISEKKFKNKTFFQKTIFRKLFRSLFILKKNSK